MSNRRWTWFAVALACSAIILAVPLRAQEFVTDGLLAFWTLDKGSIQGDVVKDAMGQHDATLNGAPKSVPAVIGEGLELNGTSDFVQIPKLGDEPIVTVEAWALATNFGGIRGIVSTFGPPEWKPGTVHFKFENSQIQAHKNDGVKITAPAELDTWFHVAYTSDTTANELKLYVNGELAAEGITGATPNNLNSMRMGSEHDGRFLEGMLDEVRIYTRALSEDEIKQNFEAKSNSLAVDPAGRLATSWGRLKAVR